MSEIHEDLQEKFDSAERLLVKARHAISQKDYEAAKNYYHTGLVVIGKTYRTADIVDDSDTKLLIGDSSIERGDWKVGLTLLDRVLAGRLELLDERLRRSGGSGL